MWKHIAVYMIVTGLVISGCAKKIPVAYDNMEVGSYAYVVLTSGETIKGEIKSIDEDRLIISPWENHQGIKINRQDIINIKQKPGVYDEGHKIIPESEIKRNVLSTNKWLFTLGGGALSFGISFFLTANILHHSSENAEGTALWAPTAGATLLGSVFFGIQGHKLDRKGAVEYIKEQRKVAAIQEMNSAKKKRQQVEKQIEEVKADREKQNKEINDILKQINRKKKKEE